MTAAQEVWLYDAFGNQLQNLVRLESIAWARALSAVGSFKLVMSPDTFPDSWFLTDRRILIWRAFSVGGKRQTFSGFLRKREKVFQKDGKENLVLEGFDNNHLLARRIIDAAAGSDLATKSGPADDVMKEYVDEWLGSSAAAADDITGLGFSVEASYGLGPTISVSATRDNLLNTLRKISKATIEAGSPVFFDIVNPSPSTYQFRTYIGVRGVDRTTPQNRKVFAPEFNNLVQPKFSDDRSREATVVIVGGPGEGLSRRTEEVVDAVRVLESPFNRIVIFADARNAAVTDLTAIGESKLRARRPERRFSGTIIDVENNRFPVDWNLGDKVVASWAGETFNVEIWAASSVTGKDGRETITAQIQELTE